ncbi:MAG TPA: arsenosugar biosynthesis radical SAM (seleno)protein ArsS [Gemmatimonadaceae bacterium]|nr:arsenosugar biosynthesis radical SAM (seleno)protein ArsS [Gemmatimonadaceae bacterium]
MSRILPTLRRRGDELADGALQRERLAAVPLPRTFERALADSTLWPLRATGIEILQINVGKRCNQTCRHCHVDAGPDRTEVMPRAVLEAVLGFLESVRIPVLDITGGAPELHPDFREIIARASLAGARVMHRCNLTAVLLPNYADIPALLAGYRVEVVASLPYFQGRETDAQRGEGVFDESIESLCRLNDLGYGRGTGLVLDLVTNPVGTFLPGDQGALERRWKLELERRYGIVFDRLYTITNMPISRFLEFLEERGRTEEYLKRLVDAFNPAAARGVMCRNTLSVGWDGALYDCDFNQMLELPVDSAVPRTIFEAERIALDGRAIAVGAHCFGCTAGSGSSCGGAVA